MKQFYEDLIAELEAMPEVAHANVFNNQMQSLIDRDAYDFDTPAVFVEFKGTEDALQRENTLVFDNFIVVFHCLHHKLHDGKYFDRNLEILDIRGAIIRKFINWKRDYISGLVYQGETPDYNHEAVSDHMVMFVTRYEDDVAADVDEGETIVVDPNPQVFYVPQIT